MKAFKIEVKQLSHDSADFSLLFSCPLTCLGMENDVFESVYWVMKALRMIWTFQSETICIKELSVPFCEDQLGGFFCLILEAKVQKQKYDLSRSLIWARIALRQCPAAHQWNMAIWSYEHTSSYKQHDVNGLHHCPGGSHLCLCFPATCPAFKILFVWPASTDDNCVNWQFSLLSDKIMRHCSCTHLT